MQTLQFRDLYPEEIEVRVGNVIKDKTTNEPKSFQLLLYKTARVDANVLDDTVGVYNWQKKFYQVKNTMVCSIGLYNEERQEWIWKDDGGDDDFTTEQVKGECSDSFKRAAFAWSLGRLNLYYAPFIWIKCENGIDEFTKLYVSEVEYKNHIISKLIIRERISDNVVYSYPRGAKTSQTSEKTPNTLKEEPVAELNRESGSITKKQKDIIYWYKSSLDDLHKDQFLSWLEKKCLTKEITALSEYQAAKVIEYYKL